MTKEEYKEELQKQIDIASCLNWHDDLGLYMMIKTLLKIYRLKKTLKRIAG